ncbi:MAG: CotH kinase family protein, partial [Verrucomicrobiota bacterium]
MKQRSWSPQLKWLLAFHLAFWSVVAVKADVLTRLGAIKKPSPGDEIFTNLNVLRIQIEIPSAGISLLRRYHWGGAAGRPTARVTVREGDTVYTNVALHLKGAAGSFRPVDWNPAMTLNFEKFAAGQHFHGLKKISLNNSVQDPSFLTEKICRELFEAAGVPVPRVAHAQVGLNGRDLGLYVLVEGFNKQFLKRYFKNTSGNLYDGGFVKEITEDLAVNSGDHPKDRSRLDALAEAASEPNLTRRLARLEKVLDMDRFLSLIAMEVMQCHWDGYAMNKNNYRVYHDLDSNRMVFFPHGLDQMFGVERAGPNTPLIPRMEGLVARSVLQTPIGRARYLERVSQLFTNVFRVELITNRVYEIAAKIGPVVAERNPQGAVNFAMEVSHLCRRIAQRAQSIEQQLGYPTRTIKFGESGIVRPSG